MEKFTGPPPPPYYQEVHTTLADLVRGAVTVGARPVGLGTPPRPFMEICWRASIVAANLTEEGDRWVRSAAYERLDPSEKSAVSYFMGMTQAETMCEQLGLASHLVHVDAVRSVVFGDVGGRTRPDLVGVDASLTYSILVEAKGRSGGWDRKAIKKAKDQVTALTPIINMTPTRIASLAYFDDDGWVAWLIDPEGDFDDAGSRFSLEAVLIAYYRPLVSAMRAGDITQDASVRANLWISRLPGMDMNLGLPWSIIEIFAEVPETGVLDEDVIGRTGSALRDAVRNLSEEWRNDTVAGLQKSPFIGYGLREAISFGPDGVLVELGPSWYGPQGPNTQAVTT
jgi:hypothetical protein